MPASNAIRQLGKVRNQRWQSPKTVEADNKAAVELPLHSCSQFCNRPRKKNSSERLTTQSIAINVPNAFHQTNPPGVNRMTCRSTARGNPTGRKSRKYRRPTDQSRREGRNPKPADETRRSSGIASAA